MQTLHSPKPRVDTTGSRTVTAAVTRSETVPEAQPDDAIPAPRDSTLVATPARTRTRTRTGTRSARKPIAEPQADQFEGPAVHPTLVVSLAILAVEVLDGSRNPSQLIGMITEDVATELRARSIAHAERRTVTGDTRRSVPQPIAVHSSRPYPNVVESAVVLKNEARAFAVAIRLEYSSRWQRWQAACLTVM